MAIERRESFADLLHRFRRTAGLTQQALADLSKVSRRTIADLERGVNRPHRTTLTLLANALQLSTEDRLLFESAARRPSLMLLPPPSVAPVSTLPHPLTRLIGREEEERAILHLILGEHARLVTLVGTAGIGKTRLAISIADTLAPNFPDGAFFVSLAQVQDWKLIPASIAQALHLQEDTSQSLWDLITTVLADKSALVVLDNLEHLLEGAALVIDLLATCPSVTILVTSRAALRVRGEQRYLVPPLSYVAGSNEISAAENLFIERAREVQPLLSLTPDVSATIAAICRRLEGIPLAIELAAMRVTIFSLSDLLHQLEHRLPLLAAGARDLPPRQQTMRDAVAWSYDLLSLRDQAIFRRLAAFVGGWTLAAAQVVCGDDATPGELLVILSSLVEANLVQRWLQEDGEETRYGMLEILREYGLDQLASHGELECTQRRHAEWMLALAQEAEPALRGPEQGYWLQRLDQELGNVRGALQWTQAHDPELGLLITEALWRYWYRHRHLREGRVWLETFMASLHGQETKRQAWASASINAGMLAAEQGDLAKARQLIESGYQIAQKLEDMTLILYAVSTLGNLAYLQYLYREAEQYHRQALALSRSLGDSQSTVKTQMNLAAILTTQGQYAEAETLLEESLLVFYEQKNHHLIAGVLLNLSNIYCKQERYNQAIVAAEKSLRYARQADMPWLIAGALDNLGKAATGQGDYERARDALTQSEAIFIELNDDLSRVSVQRHLGDVARGQGKWQQAEAFYLASITIAKRVESPLGMVKGITSWAKVLCKQGKMDLAARCTSTASEMLADLDIAPQASISVRLEQMKRALQEVMGTDAFRAAWEQGKTLSLPLDHLERA